MTGPVGDTRYIYVDSSLPQEGFQILLHLGRRVSQEQYTSPDFVAVQSVGFPSFHDDWACPREMPMLKRTAAVAAVNNAKNRVSNIACRMV